MRTPHDNLVLILVVVEDSLWQLTAMDYETLCNVLILVVVEDSLWQRGKLFEEYKELVS